MFQQTPRTILAIGVAAALTLGCQSGGDGGETEPAAAASGGGGSPQELGPDVLARIGDELVTRAEVEREIRGQLIQLDQQRFATIDNTLRGMIDVRLVDAEADRRGLTRDELLAEEIGSKLTPPTEEAIRIFHEQNSAQMGGRPLEEMAPRIAQYLQQLDGQRLQQQYLEGLRNAAGVEILLRPPRVPFDIPQEAMSKGGDAGAPVTLVEFADFECGFCRRAHPTVERLLTEYGDQIRYVFVDYPLEMHARAVPSSAAARCADEQGRFWDYFDNLMAMRGDLSDADLAKRARDLQLDTDAFNACFQSGRHEPIVNAMFERGRELGVTGTPTFLINGRMFSGETAYEDFKAMVDGELQLATREG